MSRAKLWTALALAGFIGLCWSGQAIAQESRPAGNDGDRRGWTRPSAEEMRQRIEEWRKRAADQLRVRLGATEEEWKVLQPRIEKVQTLQRQARGGMRGMTGFGGFGGRSRYGRRSSSEDSGSTATPATRTPPAPTNRDGTPRELTDIEKKTTALSEVLKKEAPTSAEITEALTALRAARAKSQQELAQARKELQEIVTPKQEAMLVLMGTLE